MKKSSPWLKPGAEAEAHVVHVQRVGHDQVGSRVPIGCVTLSRTAGRLHSSRCRIRIHRSRPPVGECSGLSRPGTARARWPVNSSMICMPMRMCSRSVVSCKAVGSESNASRGRQFSLAQLSQMLVSISGGERAMLTPNTVKACAGVQTLCAAGATRQHVSVFINGLHAEMTIREGGWVGHFAEELLAASIAMQNRVLTSPS